ncbi:hypothetical protein EsDP_00003841 [Epichloe bromicola]|uniref:Uncharacterized protein n=1 Tax=Epichloe bromicola TaxID=79588 RepID=A0ABQ0CQ14_9HYPO
MDSLQKKGPWTKPEDELLVRLVLSQVPVNWVHTAAALGTRSAKQCRERWTQTLNPELNREPITEEEGELIEKYVDQLGHRWAEIARRLNNRSDNAIKNWWNGRQNRLKRKERARAIAPPTTSHEDIPGAPSTMANATLALPQVACSATSLNSVSVQYKVTWRETPLLSPCSSELAESDSGSNYTTSPADLQSFPRHIELPPLRDWPRESTVQSQLPSVYESSLGAFNHENQLPPLRRQSQLLTAPNSPIQQQQQQQHSQKPRSADDEATSSDVARHKMRLASLLA